MEPDADDDTRIVVFFGPLTQKETEDLEKKKSSEKWWRPVNYMLSTLLTLLAILLTVLCSIPSSPVHPYAGAMAYCVILPLLFCSCLIALPHLLKRNPYARKVHVDELECETSPLVSDSGEC